MQLKQLLRIFNLREIEEEAFAALLFTNPLPASRLAKRVGISRTAMYDILAALMKRGLVYETQSQGIKKFGAVTPERLEILLKEQENKIKNAHQALDQIKTQYLTKTKTREPHLQIFHGREELQQMMKDLLLYPNVTVRAYWPIKKVMATLTPNFFQEFQTRRLKENIQLKTIWPANQLPSFQKYPFLKPHKDLKREVRLAPKNLDFSLGYTIYGNTVRFISSSKESFGFLIESHELAETMLGQFKLIWEISKPLKNI